MSPKFQKRQKQSDVDVRKLFDFKDLRKMRLMFRDVINAVCVSRNAIDDTQTGLCLTNSLQLDTGN